jgi:hypothetical protein
LPIWPPLAKRNAALHNKAVAKRLITLFRKGFMLTAVIDVRPEPIALTATLGPLVRGVVEGLVGNAMLVCRQSSEELEDIADAAGCRIVTAESWPDGFARVSTLAPASGLLVLDTGLQLGADFWPVLADILPALGARPAMSQPALGTGMGGLFDGLIEGVRTMGGRPSRNAALLLPPSRARDIALAKQDPYAIRFGTELVRLKAGVTRVELR